MAEVTESPDATSTDTVMDDGIQFQLPTFHHNPRIHLERLAVFLAFREGFAHTAPATRNSFLGNKKKFVDRRREFFEYLIGKPEVSSQLHRMKKKRVLAAAEVLFGFGHLAPDSTMNKRFAHLSAEQIRSVEWRASVSLPPLKQEIGGMVDLGPISTRTRSNCEGCRKLKLMRDESQLCDKMERMCLCVEGRTATLNGGNRGADSKGNDDDDDEVHMI
ncbi:hypothetical protein ACHAPF_000732 [Botrytis cinerea]|uniref:Uncharacterized protein n=1 Tax=Botryotinia fuckeliana (strain T4) TaxID=999810 RepID=G2Y5X7_BOTF4|nr:hypothetical protein BofuT4_P110420.1 [Botrytis cinerea T4]